MLTKLSATLVIEESMDATKYNLLPDASRVEAVTSKPIKPFPKTVAYFKAMGSIIKGYALS
jgi:hypothetical protein